MQIKQPLFSIIVATCNRSSLLERCLESIYRQDNNQNIIYEVIVSDDGTSDDRLRKKFSNVVWTVGPGKGPAANRNHGARTSKGTYLLFTDDDCIPSCNWLEEYVLAVQKYSSILVFEGKIVADRPRQSLAEAAPINELGGNLWSANMLIQRDLFFSIGGFNERFPYAAMEDVELRTRLKNSNITFQFIEEAVVCHPWRERGGWERCRKHREAMMIFLDLHPIEKKTHTAIFFFKLAVLGFLREFLPGVIKYAGRGMLPALIEYSSNFIMAYKVAVNSTTSFVGEN
jgi:GT2 family glycosyltransferase